MTHAPDLFSEETPEQQAMIERLRGRIDSAYGTDPNHWVAARLMVLSGALDEVLAEARPAPAKTSLVDATEFELSALSAVIARTVWDSHTGRSADYDDLSEHAQQGQRDRARRHLDALREFLAS